MSLRRHQFLFTNLVGRVSITMNLLMDALCIPKHLKQIALIMSRTLTFVVVGAATTIRRLLFCVVPCILMAPLNKTVVQIIVLIRLKTRMKIPKFDPFSKGWILFNGIVPFVGTLDECLRCAGFETQVSWSQRLTCALEKYMETGLISPPEFAINLGDKKYKRISAVAKAVGRVDIGDFVILFSPKEASRLRHFYPGEDSDLL